MHKKLFAVIFLILVISVSQARANISWTFDIENFCKTIYKLYQTDEVPAKKELIVYKKINELIGTTQTVKVTASDSITYDRKEDRSTVKSKEIYNSDNSQGYFGVYVIVSQKGDGLLMSCTPDKDLTATAKIADIIVIEFIKNNINQKCFIPLKDFDDKGTVIQKVIFKMEM